jgi:threonine dehydrogenase-like Zn-dependent dehydrogenase
VERPDVGPAPFTYDRHDTVVVRVAGPDRLTLSFHPTLRPPPAPLLSQQATISVWGHAAQADVARARVGIVGLGSVGSIVAEALARIGVTHAVFVDHDRVEQRNLDRTLHATAEDAHRKASKVTVAECRTRPTHPGSIRAAPTAVG